MKSESQGSVGMRTDHELRIAPYSSPLVELFIHTHAELATRHLHNYQYDLSRGESHPVSHHYPHFTRRRLPQVWSPHHLAFLVILILVTGQA